MAFSNTPLISLAFALSVLTFGEASAHPDPTLFAETAFIEAPELVDCTLEDGTQQATQMPTSRSSPKPWV